MAIGMWNYRKAVILSKQLDFFGMQELNEGTPFDDLPPFIDGIKKIYEKM